MHQLDPADQNDQATIDEIRRRGPLWIPDGEAQRMMDRIGAEAEDTAAEDVEETMAIARYERCQELGEVRYISHAEARRALGLDHQ
jgi:hypothetical protein